MRASVSEPKISSCAISSLWSLLFKDILLTYTQREEQLTASQCLALETDSLHSL
jgi:hypothetical protein